MGEPRRDSADSTGAMPSRTRPSAAFAEEFDAIVRLAFRGTAAPREAREAP